MHVALYIAPDSPEYPDPDRRRKAEQAAAVVVVVVDWLLVLVQT